MKSTTGPSPAAAQTLLAFPAEVIWQGREPRCLGCVVIPEPPLGGFEALSCAGADSIMPFPDLPRRSPRPEEGGWRLPRELTPLRQWPWKLMFLQYLQASRDLDFCYCTKRFAFIASLLHLCFPAHRLSSCLGWGSGCCRFLHCIFRRSTGAKQLIFST